MDLTIVLILQIASAIASIVLFSIGLSIVFGMMRVINLAHGEFIMLGAFGAVKSYEAGLNLWIGMFIVAPLVAGLYGLIVERFLIRHLYGRLVDTLLATWGMSLFTIGLITLLFGNTTRSVPTPLSTLTVGDYSLGLYSLFIVGVVCVLLPVLYVVLKKTHLGTLARATMQDADMVAALGYNPKTVYAVTFASGAALGGLAGGLLTPLTGVIPTMGAAFIAKAFITVISGGSAIVMGTLSAGVIFGSINQGVTFFSSSVMGEAALLLAAIVLLRFLPNGLAGRFFKGGV